MHTAADIVDCIRAALPDGSPALSNSEAALLVTLFASVAVPKAERDQINRAPMQTRMIRVGDHAPEQVRA